MNNQARSSSPQRGRTGGRRHPARHQRQEAPRVRGFSATGATGLEPATSDVTGRRQTHDRMSLESVDASKS
jgi:hypothetical protein